MIDAGGGLFFQRQDDGSVVVEVCNTPAKSSGIQSRVTISADRWAEVVTGMTAPAEVAAMLPPELQDPTGRIRDPEIDRERRRKFQRQVNK